MNQDKRNTKISIKQKVMLAFVLANLTIWITTIVIYSVGTPLSKEARAIEVQGFELASISSGMEDVLEGEFKILLEENVLQKENMDVLLGKAQKILTSSEQKEELQKLKSLWGDYKSSEVPLKKKEALLSFDKRYHRFQSLRISERENWISNEITAFSRRVMIVLILAFVFTILMGIIIPKRFERE